MKNNQFDNGKDFDWGLTSKDYAKYRDIYPKSFYQSIADLGLCIEGQRVLDLGTGTGVFARNMSKYGAKFSAVDISENQIEQAIRLSLEAGLDIDYSVASAESFSFTKKSFDVVTACQCFMYFDKAVVLPKIYEVLKDDGHLVLLYMTWLAPEDKIAQASADLVLKHNPVWTGGHAVRHQPQLPDEAEGLFEVCNVVTYDEKIPFTRQAWHGRMKACRGIGASLTQAQIAAWEKEHLAFLETLPESFEVLHFIEILDLKKI